MDPDSQVDGSPVVDDGGVWAWLLLDAKDYVVLENWDLNLNSFLLWIDEVENRGDC